MKQSDYNNNLFSNLLLQVSIECDHQINRFEHLDMSKWRKKNNKKPIYWVNINYHIPSQENLPPGNQLNRHIFVLRQIRTNYIKQIRLTFDAWHPQHKAGQENPGWDNSYMLISRPII